MKLWLTRPLGDSAAMHRALAGRGISSIVAPVMQIIPLEIVPPLRPDALLVTSRHAGPALRSLPESWRRLPVFSVGGATARVVRTAGFSDIAVGDGQVQGLLPPLLAWGKNGARLLYLRGETVRFDLTSLLAPHRILLDSVVAYRAAAAASLPATLLDALREHTITHAVFYSPRSARIALRLLQQHGLGQQAADITALCLSKEIATALQHAPFAHIKVAAQPTHHAMMELLAHSAMNAS